MTPQATLDLLASFQHTVIEELLRRAGNGRRRNRGASDDRFGRRGVQFGSARGSAKAQLPYPVYFPDPALSTDNAAMIAAAAFRKLARHELDDLTLRAQANLALA